MPDNLLVPHSPQRNADLDTLESLIDRYELSSLLEMVAEVCSAKADRDPVAARFWNAQAARMLHLRDINETRTS